MPSKRFRAKQAAFLKAIELERLKPKPDFNALDKLFTHQPADKRKHYIYIPEIKTPEHHNCPAGLPEHLAKEYPHSLNSLKKLDKILLRKQPHITVATYCTSCQSISCTCTTHVLKLDRTLHLIRQVARVLSLETCPVSTVVHRYFTRKAGLHPADVKYLQRHLSETLYIGPQRAVLRFGYVALCHALAWRLGAAETELDGLAQPLLAVPTWKDHRGCHPAPLPTTPQDVQHCFEGPLESLCATQAPAERIRLNALAKLLAKKGSIHLHSCVEARELLGVKA
jgi:hypothetical protein